VRLLRDAEEFPAQQATGRAKLPCLGRGAFPESTVLTCSASWLTRASESHYFHHRSRRYPDDSEGHESGAVEFLTKPS